MSPKAFIEQMADKADRREKRVASPQTSPKAGQATVIIEAP